MHSESEPGYLTTELILIFYLKGKNMTQLPETVTEIQEVYNFI